MDFFESRDRNANVLNLEPMIMKESFFANHTKKMRFVKDRIKNSLMLDQMYGLPNVDISDSDRIRNQERWIIIAIFL